MAIAGHVSKAMLEHYSHVRMNAKRDAAAALEGKKSQLQAAPEPEQKPEVPQSLN
jgi:hypothetical protein